MPPEKNISKASSANAVFSKPNKLWKEEIMPYVVLVWMKSVAVTPTAVSRVKSSHR